MSVEIVVTTAGRAALVNAQNTGTAPVTITQVGISQTAIVAAVGMTTLAGELKRISGVAGEVVADDTIHINMTDESADAYSLRSFALYLADGTLFGLYGQPDPLIVKTAGSIAALAIDTIFADILAALLTFGNANFTNPPATTARQGVIEIATVAEAQAGIDALRALTPQGAKAAVLGWLLSQDGAGSGLDADMLDGQHGDYYANIPARLGYWPVERGTGIGQLLGNYVKIGWSVAGRLKCTVDSTDQGNFVFDSNISDVWRASNDGAGSGLDADTVDGVHAASFARVDLGSGASFAGGVTAPYLRSTGSADIEGSITVSGAGGRFVLSSVHTSEKHIEFIRNGQTAYFYGNSAGIGLWDTQHGTVWNWNYGGAFYIKDSLAWHSGNDGAGSGLDADTVDGKQAADFGQLATPNVWAGVNRFPEIRVGDDQGILYRENGAVMIRAGGAYYGLTSAGNLVLYSGGLMLSNDNGPYLYRSGNDIVLLAGLAGTHKYLSLAESGTLWLNGSPVWSAANDGAGSGLDADLLDGKDSTWFENIAARLGFTPVRQGDGPGQLANPVALGWSSGFRLKAAVDGFDLGNLVFDGNIADVWRASNDGSGSGLDADLLDGRQASDFMLAADATTYGKNGNGWWEKRANGIIEQKGIVTGTLAQGVYTRSYPIAFPPGYTIVMNGTIINASGGTSAGFDFGFQIRDVTSNMTQFELVVQDYANTGTANGYHWHATGYPP